MIPLATVSAPVGGVFSFGDLGLGGFQRAVILLDGVTTDTDGVEVVLTLVVNGAARTTGYRWRLRELSTSGSTGDTSTAAGTAIRLVGAAGDWGLGSGAGKSLGARVEITHGPTRYPAVTVDGTAVGRTGSGLRILGMGHLETVGTVEGFIVSAIGGALTGGTVTVYGIPFGQEWDNAAPAAVESLWVGHTVAVSTSAEAQVRLLVDTDPLFPSPVTGPLTATVGRHAKLALPALAPGDYAVGVEVNGVLSPTVGSVRARDPNRPLTVAMAGDAASGSNHPVFTAILDRDPDLFLHLGDLHYDNISANDPARFHAAFDRVLRQPNQAALYARVRSLYVWDDHDFGPDNSYGGSASRPAAIAAYRARVPHPPLALTGAADPIYHAWDDSVGGLPVRFVWTDQRSMASAKSLTDTSAKSVLGTAQKAWWKDQIATAPGLVVWLCSRVWGGVPTAGADHWGGFTTERAELVAWINVHAPGRVLVLSADMHALAIDDGSHHWGLPTFQCAPLDQTGATTYGGATYSAGRYANNHQYGMMTVTKTGPGELTVVWTGYRDTGAVLATHTMVVPV
jgi:hypothetical protein